MRRFVALLVGMVLAVAVLAVVAPVAAFAATPGQALSWGLNNDGELGNGSNTDSNIPVSVSLPPATTVTSVSGGIAHSLASTSTGEVLAWGSNSAGQLGNGTNTDSNIPVPVSLPVGTTITAVAAGGSHSLALTSTGQVLAWGDNSTGQLGDGSNVNSNVPVPVSLPVGTTITAIAAGSLHSLAVTSAGQALAWGFNADGQLGDGTNTDADSPVPVLLPPGTTITSVAGGLSNSLALTSSAQVLGWGFNGSGALGDGTNTSTNTPVPALLPAGATVSAIASGAFHSLAIATSAATPTSTSLNSSANPAVVGAPVTYTATVTPEAGPGTPTGTVDFLDAGNPIAGCTARPLDVSGQATCTTSYPAPGTHTITANYSGDGTFAPSTSMPLSEQVIAATSSTTLSATPNSAGVGEPVTLTAAVTCGAGVPTGTVTFFDGVTPLGTQGLDGTGHASLVTTSLTAGSHTLTAQYNGDSNCPSSTSPMVTEVIQPNTSMTSLAANPPNPAFGQPVRLTAGVTCTTGDPTGTVTFFEGSNPIGTVPLGATGTATLAANGLSVGPHTFTAQYNGDSDCTPSTSPPVTVTVNGQQVGTTHGALLITQPTVIAPGSQIFGTVTISGQGSLQAEGVTFFGTVTASGGTGLRLCGSTVNGVLNISGMNGVIVVGDDGDDGLPACASNTLRSGVNISDNQGFVELGGNQIRGTVAINGNTTTLAVPPENATATEVEGNTITGTLTCTGNTPPPTNDGRPNTVIGARAGQCLAL